MVPNHPITRLLLNPASRWYYPVRWLILILLGLAVYGETFGYHFVFDDNFFILDTPYIRSLGQMDHIWTFFPKTRLVGIYSFALNYQISHTSPQGYHIFNFMVHLLAVGLIWALAAELFKLTGWGPFKLEVTKKTTVKKKLPQAASQPFEWVDHELPLIIAVLFLVHPCQTQAVTYISQRFESLATLFYLGSIYFYIRGRTAIPSGQKVLLFICSAGFAFLGIFTKETAATIPMMILAVELILFNGKSANVRPLPGWSYLLITFLSILFVLLFFKIVRTNVIDIYFHFTAPSSSHDGDIITGGKYVLTQMRVFLTFLRLLVFPIGQNVDYDYPLSTGLLAPPLTLAGLCVICAMVFGVFKFRKQRTLLSFGLAWILITFSINTAPRINVIFEHKLYLISFGFLLVLVCALSSVIKDRKVLFGVLIILVTVLSFASYKRNQVWQNEITLWNDAVQGSPNKARDYNGLGIAYAKQGYFFQAFKDFNKAIELNPHYAEGYNNRGNAYLKQGEYSQAIADLNKAIVFNPDYVQAYMNRAKAYERLNNDEAAIKDLGRSIDLNPSFDGYIDRGLLWMKHGVSDKALADIKKALEIEPGNSMAMIDLAGVYFCMGRYEQSIKVLDQTQWIDAAEYRVYKNRAYDYLKLGKNKEALKDIEISLRLHPNDAQMEAKYRDLLYLK